MKHSIVITSEKKGLATIPVRQHIKRCITAALDVQGVDVPCEINVLVTDDAGIRAINKAYRDIDRATDVRIDARRTARGLERVPRPGDA